MHQFRENMYFISERSFKSSAEVREWHVKNSVTEGVAELEWMEGLYKLKASKSGFDLFAVLINNLQRNFIVASDLFPAKTYT